MLPPVFTNKVKERETLTALKNICVPTDFSKESEKALSFAAEIAHQAGAELTLIHTVEEPFDLAPMPEENKKKITSRVKESMGKMIAGLKKEFRYENLRVKTTLLSGHPVTALKNQVERTKPGLIVMATRGDTGTRNLLFGSMTTEVIKHSNIPVLAVPPGSSLDRLKEIVFATDYHDGDLEILKSVIEFAGLFGSKVTVVHIAAKPNLPEGIKFRGFRELVREKLPGVGGEIHFVLQYGEGFHSGISGYLAEHPASVLVLVKHKKSFFEDLATKNHVKEMGFYTENPLLVIPGNVTWSEE